MKKIILFYFLLVCIVVILAAGCMSAAPTEATPTPTPQVIYVTVTVPPTPIATPTKTGYVYDAKTGGYVYIPTESLPPTPTPTSIPTLNKNSAAYRNYEADLQEIADIQTDITRLQSDESSAIATSGGDMSVIRSAYAEYGELISADQTRLKAAQTQAAADLAEAQSE